MASQLNSTDGGDACSAVSFPGSRGGQIARICSVRNSALSKISSRPHSIPGTKYFEFSTNAWRRNSSNLIGNGEFESLEFHSPVTSVKLPNVFKNSACSCCDRGP